MNLSFDQATEVVLKEAHALLATLDADKVKKFIAHVEKDWPEKRLFSGREEEAFWCCGALLCVSCTWAMKCTL